MMDAQNGGKRSFPGAAEARPVRRRGWRIFFGTLALLVVAVVAAAVAVALNYDWNRARGWLDQRASQAIGRHVEIRGYLSLTWARPGADQVGIARWIPMPQLEAQDVVVGNPEWAGASTMLSARDLRVRLSLLPLLRHTLSLDAIDVDDLAAALVLDAQHRNNWTFTPEKRNDAVPWTIDLRRLSLRGARITLADAPDRLDLDVQATTLDQAPYGLGFSVRGDYHGTAVSGTGRAGSLLELRGGQTYPLDVDLRSGGIRVAVTGTVADPRPPAIFDVRLNLAMHSMADVYPLTGVVLPETPPFQTAGHFLGARKDGVGRYTYENFSGRVGDSDLSGTLTYSLTQPRPTLSGTVHSNALRFADLGPAVGTNSTPPPGRVLPSEKFRVERLDRMDAAVVFSAGRIERTAGIPADDVRTTIKLVDGVLTLDPLKLGLAGGTVTGRIALDRRDTELKTRLDLTLMQLQMKQLAPQMKELQDSLGVINARINIAGSGDSVAGVLGSANGDIQMVMNQGTFSKILLEEAGLNLGSVILGKLFGDRQVQLNCLATDLGVKDGTASTRTFLLDTEDATVSMSGTIDLRDEKLDLVVRPQQKTMRILSLRSPLFVTGTLGTPKVSVDKARIAARAGGGIALGILAPFAAVLPLVAPSGREPLPQCKEALDRVASARSGSSSTRRN
jgi:uncharacterized protein involved in outer membrane biogenesis